MAVTDRRVFDYVAWRMSARMSMSRMRIKPMHLGKMCGEKAQKISDLIRTEHATLPDINLLFRICVALKLNPMDYFRRARAPA